MTLSAPTPGTRRARLIAVAKRGAGIACPDAVHAAIKRDPAMWATSTRNERPWPGESATIAECIACGSSLGRDA